MKRIKTILRTNQQFIYLALFSILVSLFLTTTNFKQNLVKPYDSRGYYAYLPALLIYNNPDYSEVLEAEEDEFQRKDNQYYLYTSKTGKKVNKYYPGVSVMQAPFFITAVFIAKITGNEVNGYSFIFMLLTYLGALFYIILGLYFLYKTVYKYIDNKKLAVISVFILFFGTHFFYNTLAKPTLSHNYSFFLFSFLFYAFQRYAESRNLKRALLIGVLLGMIFITRPTNILITLFLPFLLVKKETFISFIKFYFKLKNLHLLFTLLSFLLVTSILFILWKWQTGDWIVWSYKGESLDLTNPHFFSTLFSYRIGIFLHAPILLISFLSWWIMFKKNPLSSFFWMLYFIITVYVISSWWCWDYESEFGHRALTEHLIIFVFPLANLLNLKKLKWVTYSIVLIGFLYLCIRFYQKENNIFIQQKFTPLTYWKSLGDFQPLTLPKYYTLVHCKPIGKMESVVKKHFENHELDLDKGVEFSKAKTYNFADTQTQGRLFMTVDFDKKLLDSSDNWHNVLMIFDAKNETTGNRIYYASPIYNYFKEGKNEWNKTRVEIELYVQFQPMENVRVYIWNKKHKKIGIKNLEVTFTEIK